jgi:F-type H+-transporting ATPase subunit b
VVGLLRWSNFVILFGILGYLLRKPMGRFFSERGREILEGIARGRRAGEDAAARLRHIEARLAGLEAEIARLREAAGTEAQADHHRLRAWAQSEAEKIRAMAEQEIASSARQAHSQIKKYAAVLAVELAEQRIRARLTPERQDALLRRYAEDLKSAKC